MCHGCQKCEILSWPSSSYYHLACLSQKLLPSDQMHMHYELLIRYCFSLRYCAKTDTLLGAISPLLYLSTFLLFYLNSIRFITLEFQSLTLEFQLINNEKIVFFSIFIFYWKSSYQNCFNK